MRTTTEPATSAASASTSTTNARSVVLRHRLRIDGAGVPFLGGGFLVVVLLLTATVSTFTEVRISGWEPATQIIRWFVGAIGVYATAAYLPLYVTHGRTRREVAGDLAVFAVIYSLIVAAFVTVGFAVERLVYALAGWTQGVDGVHLFDTADQFHLILLEHATVLPVWIAGGAMLGAAFYRHTGLGMALIPVALAALISVEVGTGPGSIGPLPPPLLESRGLSLGAFTPQVAVAVAIAWCVVLTAVTWATVRDVPIRNQNA